MCFRCFKRNGERGTNAGSSPKPTKPRGIFKMDLTGKKSAKFLKERYQRKLNQQHKVVKDKRDFFYRMNHKLKKSLSEIQEFASNLEADLESRASRYNSLQNLLNKETDFEERMWKTTQKSQKVKSVTVNQKINNSEIEEAKFDSMMQYLEKYPKYASKSSFSKLLDEIKEVESGIKRTKKNLNKAVAEALKEISYFPRNIVEFRDYVKKYTNVLREGSEKVNNSRYVKGLLFKFLSEEDKQELLIDTLNHNPEHFENSVNQLEKEVNQAEKEIISLKKKFNLKE